MSVQKIFMTLIIVVACVILGAFVLNALLPNVIAGVANSAEDMLKNATGMSFDINGDNQVGTAGGDSNANTAKQKTNSQGGSNVSGYGDGEGKGDSVKRN